MFVPSNRHYVKCQSMGSCYSMSPPTRQNPLVNPVGAATACVSTKFHLHGERCRFRIRVTVYLYGKNHVLISYGVTKPKQFPFDHKFSVFAVQISFLLLHSHQTRNLRFSQLEVYRLQRRIRTLVLYLVLDILY